MQSAIDILNKVFGYSSFRFPQMEAINSVYEGKDTLVIMPTGGGKSLCYQVPSLQLEGLTVVVSPLIALMQDQISALKILGIPAVTLNSSIPLEKYNENIRLVFNKAVKLLYVAPETLARPNILDLIKKANLSLLAVDEAHCISAWGHNFRPEYRLIVEFRDNFPKVPCIALTASATPEVKNDIRESLSFKNDNVFNASFFRKNIHIKVYQKKKSNEQVFKLINIHRDDPGIIYCYARKTVDELVRYLVARGINASGYHAGLSSKDRSKCQDGFIKDNIQVVVATVAFGMGIDKSNVRFVIHKDLPKSLEGYYQEIGRSGRDGEIANAYLLYSVGDVQKIMYFVRSNESEAIKSKEKKKLDELVFYAESHECRWGKIVAYFGEDLAKNCGDCDNCLEPQPRDLDLSVLAQKVISAIYRTKSRFSSSYIIDILRGELSERAKKYYHHDLPTWGVGKDLSRKEWNYHIRQMIANNLIIMDYDDYFSLKITVRGMEVLKGKSNYFGVASGFKRQIIRSNDALPINESLFQVLKDLRKKLATEKSFPPYMIFSDKSLREMATLAPTTLPEMLSVNGVGQYKAKNYGELFIKVIRDFGGEG